MVERRRQLLELAGRSTSCSGPRRPIPGARGRSSASSTRRTTAATTRSCATSSGATTASACTSTWASAARTGRFASRTACGRTSRTCSLTRGARPSSRGCSPTSTRRARRSSRGCPALRDPDAFGSWHEYERYVRFLYDTGSITEHTQLWWSVRPLLAFPTVEIRSATGSPTSPRRSRWRRSCTSSPPGSRGRSTRASRFPSTHPARRGEPLARDPARALGRADRPRDRRGGRLARRSSV